MLKEEKEAILKEYATHEGDTGSPEEMCIRDRR